MTWLRSGGPNPLTSKHVRHWLLGESRRVESRCAVMFASVAMVIGMLFLMCAMLLREHADASGLRCEDVKVGGKQKLNVRSWSASCSAAPRLTQARSL